MAHYTKEQLESYRNGDTSVLGRIICGIHLKNCEECSQLLDELAEEDKLAIIMGTEGDGLSDQTIADCDFTVKIPMYHGVDSLNVAAASAVAFYQLGNKTK